MGNINWALRVHPAAKAERAAIIAWIRNLADNAHNAPIPAGYTASYWATGSAVTRAVGNKIADSVERGDHHNVSY